MSDHIIVFGHLLELWKILMRERATALARTVEDILAIIEEEDSADLDKAKDAWARLQKNPRGLPDFGVWREDQEERLRLNEELDLVMEAINGKLS